MKLAVGLLLFFAGMVCLAVTPVLDPFLWVVVGWWMVLIGLIVAGPVIVDWVER